MKKSVKVILIVSAIIVTLLLALVLLISPIAKYLIEKYSVEYAGRQISMDDLSINLFTGTVEINQLHLFEKDAKHDFVSIEQLYVNTDLKSFISGANHVSEVRLVKPVVNIQQDGNLFNFDDLILFYADTAGQQPVDTTPSEPVRYLIENMLIEDGTINYLSSLPQINAAIVGLNISCPKISHDDSNIALNTNFSLASGGNTNAAFQYNLESGDYNLSLDLKELNLALLFPYVEDYMYVKTFDGLITSNLEVNGNADRPADIAASGDIYVHDFSIVDTTSEELASLGRLSIEIDTINTAGDRYKFGKILLDRPFVRFAMYNDGYNFDRIMVPYETFDTISGSVPLSEYANIFRMMANYIAYFTNEYKISNYKAEKIEVTNGNLFFTDYTIETRFRYHLDSLQLLSDNLNSASDRLLITLDSRMNTSGIMHGSLSVNPDDFSEMDIEYSIRELLLSDMNPYSLYFVATPFLDGRIFYDNKTSIKNQKIKSDNHLRIEQISVGKKVKNSTAMNVPVKLAVAILRDLDGNIDLNLPVEGDVDDPDFKYVKALMGVLKNLVVKVATAPYRLLVGMFGGNEEEYKEIKMAYLQKELTKNETKRLDNLAMVLEKKPDLSLGFVQQTNQQLELETLGLFMAKQAFMVENAGDTLSEAELDNRIASLSNSDSTFNAWLDLRIGQSQRLISVQQRCVNLIGAARLKAELMEIEQQRSQHIVQYFTEKGIDPSRIKVSDKLVYSEDMLLPGPVFNITYLAGEEDAPSAEEAESEEM